MTNHNARNNIPPFGESFQLGDVLEKLKQDPRVSQGVPPRRVKVLAIHFPRYVDMERLAPEETSTRWEREKVRRELTLYELSPLGAWWREGRRSSTAPERTLRKTYRRLTEDELRGGETDGASETGDDHH